MVLRRQGGNDFDAEFGAELAAGDLNRDGKTDLIVLSAGIYAASVTYQGSTSYCPGRVAGPAHCTRLVHHDKYAGGRPLAVGDISNDSRPEIVVGVTYSDTSYGAAVEILQLGVGTPLTVGRQQTLTKNSRGVPGTTEYRAAFGSSIALDNIDRDGYADLVIGAPGENEDRGRVTVVHGAEAGWRTSGNYSYSQDTRGIPGVAEALNCDEVLCSGDRFGSAVSLRDHNRDGRLDLTVSAVGENVSRERSLPCEAPAAGSPPPEHAPSAWPPWAIPTGPRAVRCHPRQEMGPGPLPA